MTREHEAAMSPPRLRIRVRAVLAGAIVELVALGLLLMLAGGLGLWSMGPLDSHAVEGIGAGLAIFTGAAWIVAAFAGGYLAAVIARTTDRRDGVLHGVTTWAIACASAAVLACLWFMAAVATDLASVDAVTAIGPGLMLAFVVGDLLGLAGAVSGGIAGARAEARLDAPARPELRRPLPTSTPAPAGGPI